MKGGMCVRAGVVFVCMCVLLVFYVCIVRVVL